MKSFCSLALPFLIATLFFSCHHNASKRESGPRRVEILFLGHSSEHHPSAQYLPLLASALSQEGINFTYTDDPADLNEENLAYYDGLMIYANHDSITEPQQKALMNFVSNGGGFIPVHAASYCFRNSKDYVRLVGGQFQK